MAKNNTKKTSLGCFFWIAFILLIFLLFFINKNNIKSVLEKTDAKSIFKTKAKNEEEKTDVDFMEIQNEIEKITAERQGDGSDDSSFEEESPSVLKEENRKTDKDEIKNNLKDKKYFAEKKSNPSKELDKKTVLKQELKNNNKEIKKKLPDGQFSKRNVKIFFVTVANDGTIIRKAVIRNLIKSNSPMSDALNALFEGPTVNEIKNNVRSFIPPDTRLLSAYVKNGIAFINLSEEFQFNRYGIEAYQAQLAQIVFTACEFQTVKAVQFLIEGQKKEYLGVEGIWIGSPLSQSSF